MQKRTLLNEIMANIVYVNIIGNGRRNKTFEIVTWGFSMHDQKRKRERDKTVEWSDVTKP